MLTPGRHGLQSVARLPMPDLMATSLIAILIVLLSTHALPELARYRNFAWLRGGSGNDGKTGDAQARLRMLLIAALLVVLVALVQAALHRHWFGILELAFMVVVLFLCWGPRDLDADIEAVLKAPDSERRYATAQWLADGINERRVSFDAPALIEATFAAALSRRFGVLFWFALVGPVGAVAYRFVQLFARSPAFAGIVADLRRDSSERR